MADSIMKNLQDEGYPVEDLAIREGMITAIIKSKGNERIEAGDILTLRRVRNEARTLIRNNKWSGISAINEVILNSRGETIYDSTLNDGLIMPDDEQSRVIKDTVTAVNSDKVKMLLSDTFISNGFEVDITSLTESQLQGLAVSLELKNHNNNYNYINEVILEIQRLIEELNLKNAKISEYILTISDTENSKNVILLLSADLLYRDFLWWQSPEFNNETWTHSAPAPQDTEIAGY